MDKRRGQVARPRNQATYSSLPAFLLPERFTLTELERVYEQVLGVALDRTAFRRKIMDVDMPEAVAGERRGAGRRPVRLYGLRQAVPSRYNRAFATARTRSGSG